MEEQQEHREFYVDTFVARQPVFDAVGNVWGYEILYRDGVEAVSAEFPDPGSATLAVTAGICLCREHDLKVGKKILINFDEKTILDGVPLALPAANTVIQIPESAKVGGKLLETLKSLKVEGYALALDDFSAKPEAEALLKLADVVIFDLLNQDLGSLQARVKAARSPSRLLVAKRVEDSAAFDRARAMGFTHFQGFFFQRPKVIPGRKLSSTEAARFRLLEFTQQDEPDFRSLAEAIKTDVSISYRLLTYLNSPLFTFHINIQSIEQAIILLGWRQVRNWLRVIIFSDISPEGKSSELPFLCVQRGRFFESVAKQAGTKSNDRETLFMLGLFSLLEPLLKMPMAEILTNLPLESELKEALLGGINRYSPWLALAQAFEAGDWEAVDGTIATLGLDKVVVARSYSESLDWANRFFDQGAVAKAG